MKDVIVGAEEKKGGRVGGREEGLEDLSPTLQKGVVNLRLEGGLSADMTDSIHSPGTVHTRPVVTGLFPSQRRSVMYIQLKGPRKGLSISYMYLQP